MRTLDFHERFQPVEPRHLIIEQHGVERLGGKALQGRAAVGARSHLVVLLDEKPAQEVDQPVIIVDDEYSAHALSGRQAVAPGRRIENVVPAPGTVQMRTTPPCF